jgi:acylphosphatase
MAVRANVYVFGSVQAVGYRVLVKNIAMLMGVKGLVRNLEDGSVEIYAEAEKDILERFIKALEVKGRPGDMLSLNVERVEVRWEGTPGYTGPWKQYKQFEIDYGEEITRPVEREMVESLELAKLYFTKLITEFRDYRQEFRDYRQEFRDFREESLNISKETLSTSKETLGISKEILDVSKETLGVSKEILSTSKETLGISKEILGEVKGLRKDLQTILDERLTRMEKDIAEIKAKIGLL